MKKESNISGDDGTVRKFLSIPGEKVCVYDELHGTRGKRRGNSVTQGPKNVISKLNITCAKASMCMFELIGKLHINRWQRLQQYTA